MDAAVGMMETYALLREDLDNILELAQWPDKPEVMKGVESKVKAAFTRAYNKQVYKAFNKVYKAFNLSVFHSLTQSLECYSHVPNRRPRLKGHQFKS